MDKAMGRAQDSNDANKEQVEVTLKISWWTQWLNKRKANKQEKSAKRDKLQAEKKAAAEAEQEAKRVKQEEIKMAKAAVAEQKRVQEENEQLEKRKRERAKRVAEHLKQAAKKNARLNQPDTKAAAKLIADIEQGVVSFWPALRFSFWLALWSEDRNWEVLKGLWRSYWKVALLYAVFIISFIILLLTINNMVDGGLTIFQRWDNWLMGGQHQPDRAWTLFNLLMFIVTALSFLVSGFALLASGNGKNKECLTK